MLTGVQTLSILNFNCKNILAIGAHFDDVDLGAGGTLAKYAQSGCNVYKLTLTNNVTNFAEKKIKVDFSQSLNESLKAAKTLGIKQIEPKDYLPCTKLNFRTDLMQMIEKIIFDLNIDTVFAHFHTDIQQDHNSASRLSLVAARYCPRILFYQSNRYILPSDFYPRIFSDITKFATQKFSALNCYTGCHDRFASLFDQTRKQNEVWGYQISMNKNLCIAEAFVPHKWVL